MELRSTRRIVTGHDTDGKAVALYDAPLKAIQRSAGGNGMTLCWVTGEFPVDMASAADRAQTKVGVPPPCRGPENPCCRWQTPAAPGICRAPRGGRRRRRF